MADGKVTVEMKLTLDTVRAQLKQISTEMRQAMTGGNGTGGGTPLADKAVASQDKITASVKRTTRALADQVAEWKKLNANGIATGMKITDASRSTSTGAGNGPGRIIQMTGSGLATGGPNFGGGGGGGGVPPIIPPPVIPPGGNQQWWQRLGGGNFGAGVSFGGVAIGAIVGPQVAAAIAGLRLAVTMIQKAMEPIAEAIKHASNDYARALMQFKPLGWSVQEGNLAKIMGVSAETVRQFGSQMRYLAAETAYSNRVLATNTRQLTAVGWHWKTMMQNIQASFSEAATAFSPLINSFTHFVSTLAKLTTRILELEHKLGGGLNEKVFGGPDPSIPTRALGLWGILTARMGITSAKRDQVPENTASASRLPGSPWERMGLVIGNMNSANIPAVQTARNTAKTATLLEKIWSARNTDKYPFGIFSALANRP